MTSKKNKQTKDVKKKQENKRDLNWILYSDSLAINVYIYTH